MKPETKREIADHIAEAARIAALRFLEEPACKLSSTLCRDPRMPVAVVIGLKDIVLSMLDGYAASHGLTFESTPAYCVPTAPVVNKPGGSCQN